MGGRVRSATWTVRYRPLRRAFNSGCWSEESPSVRKKALFRLADLMERKTAQLDALDEKGGNGQADRARPRLMPPPPQGSSGFTPNQSDRFSGEVYSSDKASLIVQRRVPRGVVAALVPWSFPVFVAALKLAPALAAGNCVVLKPSELSSRSALRIAHLALEAGIPPGVLNIIPRLGETLGRRSGLTPGCGSPDVHRLHRGGEADGSVCRAVEPESRDGRVWWQVTPDRVCRWCRSECRERVDRTLPANQSRPDLAAWAPGSWCSARSRKRCWSGSAVISNRSRWARPWTFKTTFGPMASSRQCSQVMRMYGLGARGGGRAGRRRKACRPTGWSAAFLLSPRCFATLHRASAAGAPGDLRPRSRRCPRSRRRPTPSRRKILDSTMYYGFGAYGWTASLSTAHASCQGDQI